MNETKRGIMKCNTKNLFNVALFTLKPPHNKRANPEPI